MKHNIFETVRSLLRLVHFMFWYLLAVAVIFGVLPKAAVHLQAQYEALPAVVRLLAGIGLFTAVVIGLAQTIHSRKDEAATARLDQQY
jgi:hypothetical protein